MTRCSIAFLLILNMWGCTAGPRAATPYAPASETSRNPLRAQELTMQAASCMGDDPAKAEKLLIEALSEDLFHGPAHNNLGVLRLSQGRLFDAANEFEWACKLMPGHPDPRMNLAVTLERAGRIDEALAGYDSALEVYPDHLPTVQALARCQLRHGRTDVRTPDFLAQIALQSDDPRWRDWARLHMSK